jgi:hypothetical protein
MVWRGVDLRNPGNNVYFELDPTVESEAGEPDEVVLGVWTDHIALLFGHTIKGADIQSIYPRVEDSPSRA